MEQKAPIGKIIVLDEKCPLQLVTKIAISRKSQMAKTKCSGGQERHDGTSYKNCG